MPQKRVKDDSTASPSDVSGEESTQTSPTKGKRQKKSRGAQDANGGAATSRPAASPWTPEEELNCIVGLLAHLEVTLTPQAKQWLTDYTGRTQSSIHNWYYQRLLPRLRKAKEGPGKAEQERVGTSSSP